MPTVWPVPFPFAYSGFRLYILAKSDGRWQPLVRPKSATQLTELPAWGLS